MVFVNIQFATGKPMIWIAISILPSLVLDVSTELFNIKCTWLFLVMPFDHVNLRLIKINFFEITFKINLVAN